MEDMLTDLEALVENVPEKFCSGATTIPYFLLQKTVKNIPSHASLCLPYLPVLGLFWV